ncbi:MAG: inositol monophosphatase family protein [Candidatus Krumholzibacteriia bacterium]
MSTEQGPPGSSSIPRTRLAVDLDDRFLHAFRLAALQAGAVARRLQGEIAALQKSGERSPEGAALTAADLATQDLILLLLQSEFPDLAVDAEEDTATRDLFQPEGTGRPVCVVDPIDGTYNYARGSRDYAVMGGWLRDEAFQAAVVHFPAWGESERGHTFWGSRGGGAWFQEGDGPPLPARLDAPRNRILVAPYLERTLGDARLQRLTDEGFEVEISRCSAVDATAPVNGRAAAAAAPGPSSRRRPSGLYVTLCAGGTVLVDGRPWHGEDPRAGMIGAGVVVTAADPVLARRIHDLLTR